MARKSEKIQKESLVGNTSGKVKNEMEIQEKSQKKIKVQFVATENKSNPNNKKNK